MSRASYILNLMADGRHYTNAELCELTGLNRRQIDSVLGQLRDAGRLKTLPVFHTITDEGKTALTEGRFYDVRRTRQTPRVTPPRSSTTMQQAMARLPALQAAWKSFSTEGAQQ